MKVIDNNGRSYNWPPPGYELKLDDRRPRSELHLRCRALLRLMYPTQPVLEEVPVPGENLFCDFYLPLRKVVIECHGEQHIKFTPHFHGTHAGFLQSKKRDRRKQNWCELNNLRMAILPFNESDDEWKQRIENATD